MTYYGKRFSIELTDSNQWYLVHPVNEDEMFYSFDELVESHPVCEEASEFFFGPAQ